MIGFLSNIAHLVASLSILSDPCLTFSSLKEDGSVLGIFFLASLNVLDLFFKLLSSLRSRS